MLTSPQCGLNLNTGVFDILRQDYESCSSPNEAYDESNCVEGFENEAEPCGFGINTGQLCAYCKATNDSCCASLKNETCVNVQPTQITIVPLSSFTNTPAATASSAQRGLGMKAIIGVASAGGLILATLLISLVLFWQRRQRARSLQNRMDELSPYPRKRPSQSVSPLDTTTIIDPICPVQADVSEQVNPNIEPLSPVEPPAEPSDSFPRTRLRTSSSMSYTSEPDFLIDVHTGNALYPGTMVKCIHNYMPQKPDEMRIEEGDVIRITNLYDDFWAKGVLSGTSSTSAMAFPILCVSSSDV